MSRGSKIKCIFFSEFHPTAGPKVTYQVPEDYITKEDFDAVHVYIIPKPQLKNNLININAFHHRIIGCPVIIDNKKYKRNALIFNLCLVFDASANTEPYESVVRKLAAYLKTSEVESEFLSNEETKQRLPAIMGQLLTQLNSKGACSIEIDSSTTVNLKVVDDGPFPKSIADHDVPVLNPDYSSLHMQQKIDLSVQQLLSYMDGFSHVAKIAREADIDIAIVKYCLQNLLYHGAITVVPAFQYSNVYATCPKITSLYESVDLQQECVKLVSTPGKRPHLKDILILYCGMAPGTTIKDLCTRYNPHSLGIDERKLVQFGLVNNLIRKLHKYPVRLPTDSTGDLEDSIMKYLDGLHCFDDISQLTGLSHQDIEEITENDPSVVICWK